MPPKLALPLRPRRPLATAARPLRSLAVPPSLASVATPPTGYPRAFSTTLPLATKTIEVRAIPATLIPPYPHGERRFFKQSNHGLYAGACIRYGNVNKDRKAPKVRRTWQPNVQPKRFLSKALKAWVRVRLTTRVFRTIMKEGGIDNYVLGNKAARIKDLGPAGWKLRWMVLQAARTRRLLDEERRRLGLQYVGEELVIDVDGDDGDVKLAREVKDLLGGSAGDREGGTTEGDGAARASVDDAEAAAVGETDVGNSAAAKGSDGPGGEAEAAAIASTLHATAASRAELARVDMKGKQKGTLSVADLLAETEAEAARKAAAKARAKAKKSAKAARAAKQAAASTPDEPAVLVTPSTPGAIAPVPRKEGMLRVAMDYATPGKVSRRSRTLMHQYLRGVRDMEEWGIGQPKNIEFLAGRSREIDRRSPARRFPAAGQQSYRRGAEDAEMAAGQALQVRNMFALVGRRNLAVRASRTARKIRRKYKLRLSASR